MKRTVKQSVWSIVTLVAILAGGVLSLEAQAVSDKKIGSSVLGKVSNKKKGDKTSPLEDKSTETTEAKDSTAGEISAKVEDANKNKSPWSVGYRYWLRSTRKGNAELSTPLSYKLSETKTVSLVPMMRFNNPNSDKAIAEGSNSRLGETTLAYADKSLAKVGKVGVAGTFQWLLPTNEDAAQDGDQGAMVAKISASTQLTKKIEFSSTLWLQPFFHSKDLKANGKSNNSFLTLIDAEFAYNFTDKFSVSLDPYWAQLNRAASVVKDGDVTPAVEPVIGVDTNISYKFSKYLSLIFTAEKEVPVTMGWDKMGFYSRDPDAISYFVVLKGNLF